MRKVAIITLLAASAALGSYAFAQPGPQVPPTGDGSVQPLPEAARPRGPFQQFTRADLDSLTDARVAAIQAGLKLNPEQQKLWPPLELAIRAMAADRAARVERMRSGERPTPPADLMERLDRRAERVSQRAQRITALQSALKPLWTSFDERQKRLLPILMRPGAGGGRPMAWAGGWRGGQDRMGPGGMDRMRERMREHIGRDRMGPGGPGGGPAPQGGPRRPEL